MRDECRAKHCFPDSGPFNAGVASYEGLMSVFEMNVGPSLVSNTVILVTLV